MENLELKIKESLNTLRTYAKNYSINSYEADDLLSETILRALEKRDLYKEGTNFLGWCVTIMKNINLNKIKESQLKSTVDIEDYKMSSDFIKDSMCEESEVNDFMRNNLSDKLYDCFSLFYLGYDYESISKRLDIPIGTVKSRINNARKILKDKI